MPTVVSSFKYPAATAWQSLCGLIVCAVLCFPGRPDASAATYHLVHAFQGDAGDGATPSLGSSLIASGSTLYGMTSSGGVRTNGVLFKVDTSGSGFQVVHSFNGYSFINDTGAPKDDGAFAIGTPVLIGSTLYGMTQFGGSNGFGTVFKVNTDGSGFQVLHHFGGVNDGYAPDGSLAFDGTFLYGMTQSGGNSALASIGVLFRINTNGANYLILRNFTVGNNGASTPLGSPLVAGSVIYGMTSLGGPLNQGAIFSINTNGSGYQVLHNFTGVVTDGAHPQGSLTLSGSTLFGMTKDGGSNNVGAAFKMDISGSGYTNIHNFAITEGWAPYGDLTISGSTLYGMTRNGSVSGPVAFQVDTNGNGYQVLHNFQFPATFTDGSLPAGSLLLINSNLFGMCTLGGSSSPHLGCVFALNLGGGGGGGGGTAPTITTSSPLAVGTVGTAYSQALTAAGGTAPYTFGVAAGSLPVGLKLSGATISGIPTTTGLAIFSLKVTGKDGLSSTNNFALIVVPAPDLTVPTIAIVSPASGQRVSNNVFTATGTARDNVAVAGIYYRLNGGDWTPAATLNNWTNWSAANLTLQVGTNSLSVYAADSSANFSTTNTVKFVYVLSGPFTLLIEGAGTVTPNLSGQSLEIGKNYSLTAKAGKGFAFGNWTSDSFSSNAPTLVFTMQSNLVVTARFLDITRPVNVFVAPHASQRWSNELFTATGKASDNVGVSNVFYRLNTGEWLSAVTTNGWTNWTAELTLLVGSNAVTTFAVDAAGNRSLTNTVRFTYVLTAPIIVGTNGSGTITPNLNGQLLEIGKSYSMTAKAAKGFVFHDWTGSLITNTSKLSFVMASNLIFIAEFLDITRPVNAILSPKAKETVTNTPPVATGKATDNMGVSNVWYRANQLLWHPADLAGDGMNWSTPSLVDSLFSGSNSISAFAVDAAGNVSLTNTILFNYVIQPVADWAPDSLNGLLALATPSSNSPLSVAFDLQSFTQFSASNSDEADDYGVGLYTYTKTGTNTAQLALNFSSPPDRTNDSGLSVNLVFTNHYSGYFTNDDDGGGDDTGGFDLSIPASLVPATLAGRTLTAIDNGQNDTNTIKLLNGVNFTDVRTGHAGTRSGNYNFVRYSPVGAMLTFTFTNVADLGSTIFAQAQFTNTTGGNYRFTSFDNTGTLQDSGNGRFNLK
jgi:uncharacterized repeat protein (TIGR03803 family)